MIKAQSNKIKGIAVIIIGVIIALVGELLVFFFYGDNIDTLSSLRQTLITVGEFLSFAGNVIQLVGVIIIAKDGVKYFKLAVIIQVIELSLLVLKQVFYFYGSGDALMQNLFKVLDNISPIWEMLFITCIILGCIKSTGDKYNKMDKVIIVLVIITTVIELAARTCGGYLEAINFYSNAGVLAHCVFVMLVALEMFIEIAHVVVLFKTIKEFKEEQEEQITE